MRTAVLLLAACGASEPPCNPDTNARCPAELQCELVAGSTDPICVPPVVVVGQVFRSAPQKPPVMGARVLLVDETGVPAVPAVASQFDGRFDIPVRASRDANLRPLSHRYTLRVEASGYQVYPAAYRPSGTVDVGDATLTTRGDRFGLATADTQIGLVVETTGGISSVAGTIELPAAAKPVLVVAEATEPGESGGASLADAAGGYQVFGLPSGSYVVRGIAVGEVWQSRTVTLNVGEHGQASLVRATGAGVRVSGQVTFAGGPTTVSLAVADTWRPAVSRAEIVAGTTQALSAGGAFAIDGVPPGRYVVLAGFGNDGLVRAFANVEVAAADVTLLTTIALDAALPLVSPGAAGPEARVAPPTIAWQAQTGAARYRVAVVDGGGVGAWQRVVNAPTTSVLYDGPFSEGGFYQARVTAENDGAEALSSSEELRGVFFRPVE